MRMPGVQYHDRVTGVADGEEELFFLRPGLDEAGRDVEVEAERGGPRPGPDFSADVGRESNPLPGSGDHPVTGTKLIRPSEPFRDDQRALCRRPRGLFARVEPVRPAVGQVELGKGELDGRGPNQLPVVRDDLQPAGVNCGQDALLVQYHRGLLSVSAVPAVCPPQQAGSRVLREPPGADDPTA